MDELRSVQTSVVSTVKDPQCRVDFLAVASFADHSKKLDARDGCWRAAVPVRGLLEAMTDTQDTGILKRSP